MRRQKLNSQSYEQFHYRLKSKYKKQKQQRKQNLRQISYRKMAQSSQGSNDEQYLKKTGNKWWNRLNRHYFQKVTQQFIDNMRIFIKSDDILEFGSTSSHLHSYYQDAIEYVEPGIFQDESFRILYRQQDLLTNGQKYTLAGYRCKYKSNENNQQLQTPIFKLPNFYSFHSVPKPPPFEQQSKNNRILAQSLLQKQSKQLDLYMTAKTEDQNFIMKCLQYQTLCRNQSMSQIDKQIASWEFQLSYQHKVNEDSWDRILTVLQKQKDDYPEIKNMQVKIDQIQKFLIRSQTFSYFRSGYSDKTQQQYQKALQYIKNKKLEEKDTKKPNDNSSNFDTDCKVCFCTKNQISNKVIYCDICNTSFHQSCYGIVHIDQQKQFYCDSCRYLRKLQQSFKGAKNQAPSCQICSRNKFPIKNINGHFYHISCLILFDFAEIKQFKITFKQGVNHAKIMQAVIQNQMEHYYCEFCYKYSSSGMQFKCQDPFCTKSFHPICAYLNGCIFNIMRKDVGGIDVQIFCREHLKSNQSSQLAKNQVYLRRFLCNYRDSSEIQYQKFKQEYVKQLQKTTRSSKQQDYNQSGIRRILKLKKILSPASRSSEKRKPESLRKSQSVISNNSNSKSGSQIPKNKKANSNKEKSTHERF